MTTPIYIASSINKKYAISQEDAQKLYPTLNEAIQNKSTIEISFKGLESCSTLFLRTLLGELYLSFGPRVDDFIKYIDIPEGDQVLPGNLERLRKRALNPEIYKPIFEQAIGQA